jgi:glucokinase
VLADSRVLYNTVNIPSWKEIDLVKILEAQYQLPVRIANDANCFALGEYFFGDAQNYDTVAGLTIDTGAGTGIIIHKKLFGGKHSRAGEFGMLPYLNKNLEYYISGIFVFCFLLFENRL